MSFEPWPLVVLGVDPGNRNGWCIALCGRYIASGSTWRDDPAELHRIVSRALELGAEHHLPSMLAMEQHPWGGRGGARGGLERARGAWRSAWLHEGGIKRRIVDVNVATWRGAVLGVTRGPAVALREIATGEKFAGKAVGADEAAACGVTIYASQAPQFGKLIPKAAFDRGGALCAF